LQDNGVLRFAGIPYAKAPVGPLRWRMPEPAEPWSGVRDATSFGCIAIQEEKQPGDILKGPPGPHAEDCLFLNVWTPSCDAGKRPVMVWIHGGGFTAGAGNISAYDGAALCRRGNVVIVTINYRLGAFGFLNLRDATGGALPGTGAEGLADQIASLIWVRDNISAFGGDPGNVTLFGESAGSACVCALMASPAAKGLFHKAICESGAAHVGKSREDSAAVARAFLEKIGAAKDPKRALSADWSEALKAQLAVVASPPNGKLLPFSPTADGTVLPSRAIDAIRSGSASGIPLLAGTTRDEARLMFVGDPKSRQLDEAGLRNRVGGLVGEAGVDTILRAYDESTPADRYAAIVGDNAFGVPNTRLLEAQAAFAPSFAYRIDWDSPLLGGAAGACHVIEIGFVFGTYARDDVAYFFGTGPEADALSAAMMDCWIAFARSGNPSTATLDWPRYEFERRPTLIFGDGKPFVANDPAAGKRRAWEAIQDSQIGL
jgi:para-nitrobenzyl esterase